MSLSLLLLNSLLILLLMSSHICQQVPHPVRPLDTDGVCVSRASGVALLYCFSAKCTTTKCSDARGAYTSARLHFTHLQCDTIMKLWIAIFVLVAWVQASAGTNQRRSVAIRKVAIVGCGPAGLSLAKCLSTPTIASSPQSLPEVVDVYEGRSNAYQAAMGGGIQLSSGAFVLQQVGLGLDLDKASERIKRVVARDASCTNELFKVDVHKMVSREIIPPCYSIMRPALQELLLKAISTSTTSTKGCTKVTINTSRKVEEAIEMVNEGKVKLKFADGSETGDYDMVFGADGLNSKILSSAESPSILASYSGIRVVYCVTPPDEGFKFRQVSLRGQFSQYFGDGLYALCATYGKNINSSVIIYCPHDLN